MSNKIQMVIDQIVNWDVEDLERLQSELDSVVESKIENLPDDDEGF